MTEKKAKSGPPLKQQLLDAQVQIRELEAKVEELEGQVGWYRRTLGGEHGGRRFSRPRA